MKKYAYGVIVVLAFANIVVWPYVLEGQNLQVTFLDVGQGDAIFIQTPQGHQILIDGGPNNKVVEKISSKLPFWDNSIDLMILTHPDADHITGLVDVLHQYNVQNVLWTGVEKDTNIFASWKAAVQEEQANVWLVQDPQRIFWSSRTQEGIRVLYAADQAKEVNDTSVVTKLYYGKHSFLFPGDITKPIEQELVQQEIDIAANVLKVAHHGSKSSSAENFLAAVNPQIAVIQAGYQNRYGHPHQEVLSRFSNIHLLRTDQNGDIVIQTNGKSLIID